MNGSLNIGMAGAIGLIPLIPLGVVMGLFGPDYEQQYRFSSLSINPTDCSPTSTNETAQRHLFALSRYSSLTLKADPDRNSRTVVAVSANYTQTHYDPYNPVPYNLRSNVCMRYLGRNDDWLHVEIPIYAYIRKDGPNTIQNTYPVIVRGYIPSTQAEIVARRPVPNSASIKIGEISTDKVALRIGANVNHARVALLNKGTQVRIISKSTNGFYEIEADNPSFPKGINPYRGFIEQRFLTLQPNSQQGNRNSYRMNGIRPTFSQQAYGKAIYG